MARKKSGRPRVPDSERRKNIQLTMDPQALAAMAAFSQMMGVSRSVVVSQAMYLMALALPDLPGKVETDWITCDQLAALRRWMPFVHPDDASKVVLVNVPPEEAARLLEMSKDPEHLDLARAVRKASRQQQVVPNA